jgi:hypothetical protein
MRRSAALFFPILLAIFATAHAQVVPSSTTRQSSITVGGIASIFQPDFVNDPSGWICVAPCNPDAPIFDPVAQASSQPLFGVGAYVDVRLRRWVQLEAEGRWLRFNQYNGVFQDNYLIGPRLPVYHKWKSTAYVKALGGYSKMQFGTNTGTGRFTDLAFGGGVDVKLTKRISFRAVDVEYHYWPQWGNSTISPYGASMGIGYKIF